MTDLGNPSILAREALKLMAARRIAPTPENFARYYRHVAGEELAPAAHTPTLDSEPRGDEPLEALRKLARLLVDTVATLVEDDRSLAGELAVIRTALTAPLSTAYIAEAERSVREIVFRQGLARHSVREATSSLRRLVTLFADRLCEMTESADSRRRIAGHAEHLMHTHDLADLGAILGDLMRDTRSMQLDMMRYHDETMHARRHADDALSRMREVTTELERVNTQLSRDPVTGTLNRRGLEEAMHREMSRAERRRTPLSLGVLALDRLARLREGHGQRVADDALKHVLGVAAQALRPTDLVAHRGGEAFVILFSDTALAEAGLATQRLQGALSRNPFPHGDRRLSLTCSAGLAQLRSGDTQAALVARADRAVRRAQSRGANRVVAP